MHVDVADATPPKAVPVDELAHLHVRGHACPGQIQERAEDEPSLAKRTEGKLADDERVHQHHSRIEETGQRVISRAKMVDPHRCVGQDHANITPSWAGAAAGP